MGASYSKRALVADYQEIKDAKEILRQQTFAEDRPRPVPDFNSNGQLFFPSTEQLSTAVTQSLIKRNWECKEVHKGDTVIYEYTHERTMDFTPVFQFVSCSLELAFLLLVVGGAFSYKVMYEVYGVTWFTPGTLKSA